MRRLALHRLLTVAIFAIVAAVVFDAVGAQAQGGGFIGDHGGGTVTGEGTSGETPAVTVGWANARGAGEPGEDPCGYQVGDYTDVVSILSDDVGAQVPGGLPDPDDPQWASVYDRPWVVVWCPGPFGVALSGAYQLGDPPPTAYMQELAERYLDPPVPEPQLSPSAGVPQLVGLETWVWVAPQSRVTQVEQPCIAGGAACATITATYSHLEVDMGDGTAPFTCAGTDAFDVGASSAAQADEPHCGHVYTEADPTGYDLRIVSVWTVEWSCRYDSDLDGVLDASCGGGPLDPVGRQNPPTVLVVQEIQATASS